MESRKHHPGLVKATGANPLKNWWSQRRPVSNYCPISGWTLDLVLHVSVPELEIDPTENPVSDLPWVNNRKIRQPPFGKHFFILLRRDAFGNVISGIWICLLEIGMAGEFNHPLLFMPKEKMIMKHKNFGPECKTRVSASISSFGSKAKMSRFAPNIFWTFYQFSGSLSLTIEYSKKIVVPFFRFGKIWPIFTLDMVKNWKFWNFS